MLAKIVKANFARVLEKEQAQPRDADELRIAPEQDSEQEDFEESALFELNNAAPSLPPIENYQAAYDELIITAQDEVAAMLEDARSEALAIISEAEDKVGELRDQAWEEGYSNAYNQAKNAVEEVVTKANKEADALKKQLSVEREKYLQSLEQQMLGIALDVAGKILSKELDSDDNAYLSMLREAVARMPAEDAVSIRLHPEEYERFFNKKETTIQTPNGNIHAKLIADPTLERYDALIESPSGVVDAGATTQLEQMKRNFGM